MVAVVVGGSRVAGLVHLVVVVAIVVVVVKMGQRPIVILTSSIAMSPECLSPLTPTNAN